MSVTGSRARDRQTLTGVIISGAFGLAWGQWAATGAPAGWALGIRIASTVIGVTIIARAARLRRAAAESADSMFRSAAYRWTVLAEAVVLLVALGALVATSNSRFVSVAVAGIAALHFVGFGYRFSPFFYGLAAGLGLAAVAGLLVGLGTAHVHTVEAVTGLLAAAVLFGGAFTRLVR